MGEVIGYRMGDDLYSIVIDILIFDEFTKLVNTTSQFFSSSGFTVDARLSGIEVHADNISTILTGGISFVTLAQGEPVESGSVFPLYKDRVSAQRKDDLTITLHMDLAQGVRKDTKIRYQGIEIGSITDVRLGPEMKEVLATASVVKETATLFRDSTKLWLVKPSIDMKGIHNISTMLTGPHISVSKGEGKPRVEFIVQSMPPRETRSGLNIVLDHP